MYYIAWCKWNGGQVRHMSYQGYGSRQEAEEAVGGTVPEPCTDILIVRVVSKQRVTIDFVEAP